MKAGLSLIECLVYLAGSSLLILCVLYSIIPYVSFLSRFERQSHTIQEILYALSHIERDLQKAPALLDQWNVMDTHHLVWHSNKIDYGWRVENNCLLRYQGTYQQGQWHNVTKTLVLHHLTSLIFTPEKKNNVLKGIWCTLKKDFVCLSHYIHVYEGMVVQCN